MDGEELTEQETALYDRQIRVWGAGAQRRYVHICDDKVKYTRYKVSIFIKYIFHELILLFCFELKNLFFIFFRLSKAHILVCGITGTIAEVIQRNSTPLSTFFFIGGDSMR